MPELVVVVGVDPGLVHTGVVLLEFERSRRRLTTRSGVVDGLDPDATFSCIASLAAPQPVYACNVFIEKYRPRSGFAENYEMVAANKTFASKLQGDSLYNSGIKRVVKREMLEALGVWSFMTTTHHQDLRSAARIAVLGMLQDRLLNEVLYDFFIEYTDPRGGWDVRNN